MTLIQCLSSTGFLYRRFTSKKTFNCSATTTDSAGVSPWSELCDSKSFIFVESAGTGRYIHVSQVGLWVHLKTQF